MGQESVEGRDYDRVIAKLPRYDKEGRDVTGDKMGLVVGARMMVDSRSENGKWDHCRQGKPPHCRHLSHG